MPIRGNINGRMIIYVPAIIYGNGLKILDCLFNLLISGTIVDAD